MSWRTKPHADRSRWPEELFIPLPKMEPETTTEVIATTTLVVSAVQRHLGADEITLAPESERMMGAGMGVTATTIGIPTGEVYPEDTYIVTVERVRVKR